MEFSKVDKSRRMVAGWATLDNVDTEGDIVTAEASIDAFNRSRRNLREMHKKDSAVGRIVSYKEDTFTAPDGEKYRGVFVKVRVSEGAEDTWKKVLDGTLNGFSIGGSILESEEIFQKDSGQTIRKVNKYDLTELSLVDNPGNQYSDITNVFKMRKSADGSVTSLTGMVEEQKILNIFYCSEDEISKEAPSDSYDCPVCDNSMSIIGFIEDGEDRSKKVSTLVTKYLSGEGGVTMQKARKEEVDGDNNVSQEGGANSTDYVNDEQASQADPTGPAEEVGDVEEVDESEQTPSEDVEEVHDEGEEISKKIDSLKTDISDILSKNNKDTAEKIEALEKAVTDTHDFFEKKISELDSKFNNLNTNLEATKSRQAALEASLNKINSSGAFRKSADLDNEPVETVQKSDTDWNGAFSVDNLFG
jgi:phage head maturation protease